VSEAIGLLQKAVAADPEFAMAYARIGYAHAVSFNQAEQGKPYLEQAFRRSSRLTDKDRLYIAAWYAIANFDYQPAQSPLRDIIRKDAAEIEAYKELGMLLQGDEQYEEAIDVLSRALALDPNSPEICNALGAAYRDIGKYADAAASHRQYVALAPTEPNAWDSLGLTYQAAGDYGLALEAFDHALQLNPTFGIPIVHLGNLYFQLGRYREALRHYHHFIDIASFDEERARGYAYIAWVHFKMGDLDRAWQFAKTALSRAYTPVVWNAIQIAAARGDSKTVGELRVRFQEAPLSGNRGRRQSPALDRDIRGYLAMKDGNETEALTQFREVVRHPPVYWNIEGFQTDLADAYLSLGRVKPAIGEYERVLALNPNLALARYHLGEAYDRLGDPVRARIEYERFLKIWDGADPDIPELVAAKTRMRTSTTE
jgi:tetratricopeptide (TPR) repeat protein